MLKVKSPLTHICLVGAYLLNQLLTSVLRSSPPSDSSLMCPFSCFSCSLDTARPVASMWSPG